MKSYSNKYKLGIYINILLIATTKVISDTYVWRIRLAKIENQLARLLVSSESTKRRIDTITELDLAFQQWRNDMPSHLRPGDDYLIDRDTYQFVAVAHLEYFNILRAIHWASINCIRSIQDAEIILDPRMGSSEALCLAAARSL